MDIKQLIAQVLKYVFTKILRYKARLCIDTPMTPFSDQKLLPDPELGNKCCLFSLDRWDQTFTAGWVAVAIHWKHDYDTHDVDVGAVGAVGDGDAAAAGAVLTCADVIISRL